MTNKERADGMDEKLQELLNRRPKRWGNVSVKTFEQDIARLQEAVKNYQSIIHELKELATDYRNGVVGEMTDSFLVDEMIEIIEVHEKEIMKSKEPMNQ